MFKQVLALVIFMLSVNSLAQECLGEAQIYVVVTGRETDNLTYCKATFDASNVRIFNSSVTCPLDLSEVIQKGLSLPLMEGHDCNVFIGDHLSGVITKQKNGQIYLD